MKRRRTDTDGKPACQAEFLAWAASLIWTPPEGRPELLAPAGSPEALRAAVECGADAVYLGWGAFNARERAKGFTDDEFRDALAYCHLRGAKVYLTLNTLLSDSELPSAWERARAACRLGVDAVLVQDWGLLDLLRETLPDLPLHASTQMSVLTAGGAELLHRDGCTRVVIGRECSRDDTASILRNTGAEIETFVHGALCVSCSGQCAMSALIGGRSGNRGRCAQPCRLPCRVVRYGAEPDRGGDTRALNLKDLNLAPHIPELSAMGLACLKIEGRLKRPEYVAVVTEIYARLLRENRPPSETETAALSLAFTRTGSAGACYTDGFWTGRKGPGLFRETVSSRNAETNRNAESGRRGASVGDAAAQNRLFASARAAFETDFRRRIPIQLHCKVTAGTPCVLTASDREGHTVTVTGPVPETARTRDLTVADIEARLRKTGGTVFVCERAEAAAEPGLSLSAAALNALRRDALEALSRARTTVPIRRELSVPPVPTGGNSDAPPRLTVSVMDWGQVTAELLAQSPARVYVPLELADGIPDGLRSAGDNPDGLREGGTLPGDTPDGGAASPEWCVILPRLWRDREEPDLLRRLDRARDAGFTGALLGNIGHFALAARCAAPFRLYGDFGLNAFNSRSLACLKRKGLSSVCASFELRMAQIRDLGKPLPVEAVVYGRLPLMAVENSLLPSAAGNSVPRDVPGNSVPRDASDETRAPETADASDGYALTDRTGTAFPLFPAYGGRMEIENSRPVWLADKPQWLRAGLSYARLRFTTETPEDCAAAFWAYRDALAGEMDCAARTRPAEFTRGLYERGVE